MAKNNELDMLNGALLPKILMFSLPLALTGILQLLFNAADVIVVGKFAGSTSLAAVGATSALVNLLTGAFIGISVGVNILVARYIGCRDDAGVSRAVHSAVTLSLLLGVVTFLLGFFLSTPMLELMGTPDDVLRLASLYLRIYFIVEEDLIEKIVLENVTIANCYYGVSIGRYMTKLPIIKNCIIAGNKRGFKNQYPLALTHLAA